MKQHLTITTCDLCGLPIKGPTVNTTHLHARDRRGRAWTVRLSVCRPETDVTDPDLHPACLRSILRGLQRRDYWGDESQTVEAQSVRRAMAIGGALPAFTPPDEDN